MRRTFGWDKDRGRNRWPRLGPPTSRTAFVDLGRGREAMVVDDIRSEGELLASSLQGRRHGKTTAKG
jgi:hypothetical protein